MTLKRTMVAEPVSAIAPAQKAWNYPLFDAIFQRRARRFPLGAEMPGDLAPFKSAQEPVPLDEIEEAMLVMAGTGISGINLSDLPFNDQAGANWCGNTMLQFVGRVYASACGSHGTELFFTNDDGTYLVKLRDKLPSAMQEFAGLDDREKIVQACRANTVKIGDGRLGVPMVPGITQPFNWWNVNQPGSTLFMPVSDLTWEYINVLMLVMDEPNSYYIYDDLNNNAEPLREWADKGYLDRSRPYALSTLESSMQMIIPGTEQAIMLQNMYLALQAMGLGGWIFSSSVPPLIMQLMGFRFHVPERTGPIKTLSGEPQPSPVGLDGLFQSYCPPYYPDMGAAVQAIYDAKWGSGGIYKEEGGPAPYKDRQSLDRLVQKTPAWCLEAAKALCDYIWRTYGRFPATVDPMMMNIWFQAHHLETEFYDRYYQPGAYHQAVKEHMAAWHGAV
ncbi:MAG: hypothetical protein Q7T33_01820 [Dehalococcoidia bacterium]|nr:hypothetical protein [Dehalococcoidia bacterium]